MELSELIKENPGINLTVNARDLMSFAQSIADTTAKIIIEKKDEKLFTRKEIIKKFNVCSTTLWRWDKLGIVNGKKIGNRRYYPESEIKALVGKERGAK